MRGGKDPCRSRQQRRAFRSVVVPGLDDDEVIASDGVDEAVLLVEAARPVAGEVSAEAFGFAGADTGVACRFLDESVDAEQGFAVSLAQLV